MAIKGVDPGWSRKSANSSLQLNLGRKEEFLGGNPEDKAKSSFTNNWRLSASSPPQWETHKEEPMQNRNFQKLSARALAILFILFLLFAGIGCDDSDSTDPAKVDNPPAGNDPVPVDPVPQALSVWGQDDKVIQNGITLQTGETVDLTQIFSAVISYQNKGPNKISWADVELNLVDPDKAGDLVIEDADPDTEGVQPRLRAVAVPNGGYAQVRVSHRTLDITPFDLVVHIQEPPAIYEPGSLTIYHDESGWTAAGEQQLFTPDIGDYIDFQARVMFTDGNIRNVSGDADWDFHPDTGSPVKIEPVNFWERATALAAGSGALRVTYEGDTFEVRFEIEAPVIPPVLSSALDADPASLNMTVGTSASLKRLSAIYVDGDGAVVKEVKILGTNQVLNLEFTTSDSAVFAQPNEDGTGVVIHADALPTNGQAVITIVYTNDAGETAEAQVPVTVAPQPPVLTGYQVVVGGKTYPLEEAEGPRTLEAILGSGFGDFALQAVYDYGDPSEVDFTTSISEEVVRVNDDGSLQVIGIGRAEVYFNLPDGMQAVWPLVVIGQVGMVNDLTDQTTFALTEDRVYTDNGDPVDDDQLFLDQFPACFNSNYCSGGEVEHVVLSRVPGSPAGIKVPLDSLTRVFRVALAAYTVAGDGTPSSPVWVEFKFLDSEGNSLGSAWRQSEIFGFIDGTPSEAVYVGATLTTPEGAVAMEIVPEVSSGAPVRMDLPRYIAGTLDRPEFYYDGTREQFPELEVQ